MDGMPLRELRIVLPAWCDSALALSADGGTTEGRMRFVIELARRNVAAGTGGPFGAAIFDLADGSLLGWGVNCVESAACSAAHAEIVALTLAQQSIGGWHLGAGGARRALVSSVEPCAMCLGAIPWSGVTALECGAAAEDAEAIGFDEGDKPQAWIDRLRVRGVTVTTGILREEASAVLQEYARRGGALYQPRDGG